MIYDKSINVAGHVIAVDKPAYFIADIAANHDGDLSRAKDLIYLAKDAGADCAKFQHFLAQDIVSDHGFSNMGPRQSHQSQWKKSVYEVYEQYHCPRDWTDELVKTCNDAGIDFSTTPYDVKATDMLAKHVCAFKIGSGDITWTAGIEHVAKAGKPVFLACGASSMNDVERAVDVILLHTPQIVLMQCNTNYTADHKNYLNINLNVLKAFAQRWPNMILGLSDHTFGHATVLGAVAMGAKVIEKHFTDDNSLEGPDHHFAMNPNAWRDMVERTRELEMALGDGIKKIEENEKEAVVIQRRAIRIRASLVDGVSAGTAISETHLEVLRPCPQNALEPYEIKNVLGKVLKKDMVAGEHLQWNDLI